MGKSPKRSLASAERAKMHQMRRILGSGPMRFGCENERSIEDQIAALSPEQHDCIDQLRVKWEKHFPEQEIADEMILRAARNSPGKEAFNAKAAWRVLKGMNVRYLSIGIDSMERQLLTKTLFPLPGVKTAEGQYDVFYMRPCRYANPKITPTRKVIDNLVYCMNSMLEKEDACTNGIGFVACMDDWTMKNYNTDYCFQFMQALQGRTVPVRVNLFLIVNPPSWFDKVWSMMKKMLSSEFQKKVKMIPESDLPKYLAPGYEAHLPDEMSTGQAPTEELVNDWVAYRKYAEASPTPGMMSFMAHQLLRASKLSLLAGPDDESHKQKRKQKHARTA